MGWEIISVSNNDAASVLPLSLFSQEFQSTIGKDTRVMILLTAPSHLTYFDGRNGAAVLVAAHLFHPAVPCAINHLHN